MSVNCDRCGRVVVPDNAAMTGYANNWEARANGDPVRYVCTTTQEPFYLLPTGERLCQACLDEANNQTNNTNTEEENTMENANIRRCYECGCEILNTQTEDSVNVGYGQYEDRTTGTTYYITNEGDYLCEHCFEEHYFVCDDCGEIYHNDEMHYEDGADRRVCPVCDGEYEECECCHEMFYRDNMTRTEDGNYVCDGCFNEEYYACDDCECIMHRENTHFDDDGTPYCDSCYEERYTWCHCCDTEIPRDEAYYTAEGNMCQHCIEERGYIQCDECGDWVLPDESFEMPDGSHVCETCIHRMQRNTGASIEELIAQREEAKLEKRKATRDKLKKDRPPLDILSYHRNTTRVFLWQDGEEKERAFFGIELEVENKGDTPRNEMAVRTLIGLNRDVEDSENRNHWTAMYDGSLNSGFELISQPMTARYFDEEVAPVLERSMDDMTACGLRSHDTSTCGLHFHVSKNSLTPDTMVNMKIAVDKFKDVVRHISRRKEESLDRWASITQTVFLFRDHDKNLWENIYEDEKRTLGNVSRYSALNFTNANTVEFRACRGTLKYESFIGCFHFFRFLIDWCAKKTFTEILDEVSLDDFLADMAAYSPELKAYMAERPVIKRRMVAKGLVENDEPVVA